LLLVASKVMSALNVTNYSIKINSRKILNSLVELCGIQKEMTPRVLRVLDKLPKIGIDAVILELSSGRMDESGDVIKGLGLNGGQIVRLSDFLNIAKQTKGRELKPIEKIFEGVESAKQGIDELSKLDKYLNMLEVGSDKAVYDYTLARGMGYYTGPIYEISLTGLEEYGSVASGGRYDNLVERFSSRKMPATGFSVGVDRFVSAIKKTASDLYHSASVKVLVTVFDREKIQDYILLVNELRSNNIFSEIYVGDDKGLGGQLKYANAKKIPFAIIIGPSEFEKSEVALKDLREGIASSDSIQNRDEWLRKRAGQRTLKRSELVNELKKLIDLMK